MHGAPGSVLPPDCYFDTHHIRTASYVCAKDDAQCVTLSCLRMLLLYCTHALYAILVHSETAAVSSAIDAYIVHRFPSSQRSPSCSTHQTLQMYSCDVLFMLCCSTLVLRYGHQDPVTSIDCSLQERPVTEGGADKSVRVWKIVEESQLVFGGYRASIDCVNLVIEEHFVSWIG